MYSISMEFCGFFWNIIQPKNKKGQKGQNCLIFGQQVSGSYREHGQFRNFLYGNSGQKMGFEKRDETATYWHEITGNAVVSSAN